MADSYKNMCIIGYILAGLCAVHHWAFENKLVKNAPSKSLTNLYYVGGLITLYCAFSWLMKGNDTMMRSL